MPRSAERAEVWAERVERWKASGLKQLPFCKREGIPYHGFKRWRQRLEPTLSRARRPRTLVPVKLAAAGESQFSAARTMEIRLSADRRIVVGADFDEAALHRLIRSLERLAC